MSRPNDIMLLCINDDFIVIQREDYYDIVESSPGIEVLKSHSHIPATLLKIVRVEFMPSLLSACICVLLTSI